MDDLAYPRLGSPYDEALRSCVAAAFREYRVLAIVVSGTILRGTPDRRSDLDVHVLHRQPFRERVQAWHCGVPTEVFVNHPDRILRYFREEAEDRRPMTAHMFATGLVLFDTDQIAAKLVTEARAIIEKPPHVTVAPDRGVYGAATMFEDADDLADRDPEAAALILGQAVFDLAQARVAAEPGWTPRAKDLLTRLREIDPICADLVVRAISQANFKPRLEAARELCVRVAGTDGFFEWRSPRDETTS